MKKQKIAEKPEGIPQDMKNWIDNASYESMLYRWRFSPADSSSPWFQGEVGEYYAQVMFKKRDNDQYGAVLASKRVGWEKK